MTTVYIQSEKIVEEEIAAEEENIKDPWFLQVCIVP
jgi:hypothetical protein